MMNGYDSFEKHHLEDDAFSSSTGNIVSAFDAFRTSPPSPWSSLFERFG